MSGFMGLSININIFAYKDIKAELEYWPRLYSSRVSNTILAYHGTIYSVMVS